MNSVRDTLAGGFPHSEICGSLGARPSPQLIAACHVLHRLSAPRHPPDALLTLDRSAQRSSRAGTDVSTEISSLHTQDPLFSADTSSWRNSKRSVDRFVSSSPCPTARSRSWDRNQILSFSRQRLDWRRFAIVRGITPHTPRPRTASLEPLMVEATGVEPTTSCLQSRRSTN